MCMNHLSFFCGYPSYAFDFESFPYSVSILDFFYLKVNTLYTFVFVHLTGNNEIWQTLPQNKKMHHASAGEKGLGNYIQTLWST